nr:hypothetical protein HK105_008103 [Polyrhizophydium stewartii]
MPPSIVTFNAGGVRLQIPYKTLAQYPESRLYELVQRAPPALASLDASHDVHPEVFVDANPLAFLVVLDFLRYHQLLVPRSVSREVVLLLLQGLRIPADASTPVETDEAGPSLAELHAGGGRLPEPSSTAGFDAPPSYDDASGRSAFGSLGGGMAGSPLSGSLKSLGADHLATGGGYGSQPLFFGGSSARSTAARTLQTRVSAFVGERLHPLVETHAAMGHRRVRIYVLPSGIDRLSIVNDTRLRDPGAIEDFITLKTDRDGLTSDMDFLLQPDASKALVQTLTAQTGVRSANVEVQHITVRRQNAFGLFESTSLDIIVIAIQV